MKVSVLLVLSHVPFLAQSREVTGSLGDKEASLANLERAIRREAAERDTEAAVKDGTLSESECVSPEALKSCIERRDELQGAQDAWTEIQKHAFDVVRHECTEKIQEMERQGKCQFLEGSLEAEVALIHRELEKKNEIIADKEALTKELELKLQTADNVQTEYETMLQEAQNTLENAHTLILQLQDELSKARGEEVELPDAFQALEDGEDDTLVQPATVS